MFGLVHMMIVLIGEWIHYRHIKTEIEIEMERFLTFLHAYQSRPLYSVLL